MAVRRRAGVTSYVCVEQLETRRLCAASPLSLKKVLLHDGTTQLLVVSNRPMNAIRVSQAPGKLTVRNGSWTKVVQGTFSSVEIYAGKGASSVTVDANVKVDCILHGGPNDTLQGGAGDDTIYSGTGKSVIKAGSGDDTIVSAGGKGSSISGGRGIDNFWIGPTDKVTDTSSFERSYTTVHTIRSFMNYWMPSGKFVKVPMTLAGQDLPDPVAPAAVAYAHTRGYPLYGPGGPAPTDIRQQDLGDCYFLATLSSMAHVNPTVISYCMTGLGDGTYVVEFFNSGRPVYVRVDGTLPVNAQNEVIYGNLGPANSIWVAVMEKAWAIFRNGVADYSLAEAGLPGEVYQALNFSFEDTQQRPATIDQFVQTLWADQESGRAAVYSTNESPADPHLVPTHAYMVDSLVTDDDGFVAWLLLRNPWGTDYFGDPTYDGYTLVDIHDAYDSFLNYCSAGV